MAATIITICDAVVAAINAATLSQALTAARQIYPEVERKELGAAMTAWVIPASSGWERISRAASQGSHVVAVAVRGPAANDAALAAGLQLMQEIKTLFLGQKAGAATCVAAETDPLFEADAFGERAEFLAEIRLTFSEY